MTDLAGSSPVRSSLLLNDVQQSVGCGEREKTYMAIASRSPRG